MGNISLIDLDTHPGRLFLVRVIRIKSSSILTILLVVTAFAACNPKKVMGPSEEELQKIFHGSPEEIFKKTRWDWGGTTISNEARLDLFQKTVTGLRGGYVGVGSTQNFLMAAWADSEWLWLMDFTRIVVIANRIHIAFIKESPTAEEYMALWKKKNRKQGLALVKKHFEKEPDYKFYVHAYKRARPNVWSRFRKLTEVYVKRYNFNIWLTDPILYKRVRNLVLKNRIRAMGGDLNGTVSLRGIGTAAKKMGIKIHIYYPSNAEEYKMFNPYPKNYRDNVRNLPADKKSVVVRTISYGWWRMPWAPGWKKPYTDKVGFHFNEQPLGYFQKLLVGNPKLSVYKMLSKGKIDRKNGYSITISRETPAKTAPLKKASGS